jgi:hypothetical protein
VPHRRTRRTPASSSVGSNPGPQVVGRPRDWGHRVRDNGAGLRLVRRARERHTLFRATHLEPRRSSYGGKDALSEAASQCVAPHPPTARNAVRSLRSRGPGSAIGSTTRGAC